MTFADIVFERFDREVTEEDLSNPGTFSNILIPLSAARNEVPLFANDPAVLFQNPTLVFNDIKIARSSDGAASVKLPMSDYFPTDNPLMGLEAANVACVRYKEYKYKGQSLSTDRYRYDFYYVTGYRELTNKSEEDPDYPDGRRLSVMDVEVDLQLIPFTTYMQGGTVVNMIPERMPVPTDHVMQNWTQSIMVEASTQTSLPQLPKIGTVKKGSGGTSKDVNVLWCEISYIVGNEVKRYGIFIPSKQVFESIMEENVYAGSNNNLSARDVYPSLRNIMNDPITYLGITGATVTDVNISEFCPYIVTKKNTDITDEQYIRIIAVNDSEIAPTATYTPAGFTYYAYDLTYLYLEWAPSTGNPGSQPKLNKGTLSITLTDFEKYNGQLSIKDSMRNDVLTLPRENLDSPMTVNYFTYSDLNNIYLVLEYLGTQITLPGHKIPWATSMWDTYRSFSLQFDRQALQNNIDASNREMNIALIDAAATGIIGGALAGALTGGAAGAGLGLFTGGSSFIGSAISGGLKREEDIRKMIRDQELTEQRMKGGASTMNNNGVSTGVINMINQFGGAELIFRMPAGFTEAEWTAQTATWGYPSNKVMRTLFLDTEGYWKGRMYPTFTEDVQDTAVRNAAIRQLEDGFYLVPITYE